MLHYAGSALSLLELGLGHGYTTEIFSQHIKCYVVLKESSAVARNFKEKHPGCRAEIMKPYFEDYNTEEIQCDLKGFHSRENRRPTTILESPPCTPQHISI